MAVHPPQPPHRTVRRPLVRPRLLLIGLVLLFVVASSLPVAAAAEDLFIIGTGSVVGLYYPVGGAVSLIVNNTEREMVLTVKVTPGSIANVEALEHGNVDLALVQSDVLHQAVNGEAAFSNAAISDLRTVMGLHAEPLHLVCRRDAGVETLADIAGKRVSIGAVGSGVLNTVRTVLAAVGLDEERDFIASHELPDDIPEMLAGSDLDCFFFTVGIGSAAIAATATLVDINLVPLDAPELVRLSEEVPYYAFFTVPSGTYRGVDEDVTVFGVRALLVVSARLPEETVYKITRALLASFQELRATYPVLETLMFDEIANGLSAPLHAGAQRAYREAGLLEVEVIEER